MATIRLLLWWDTEDFINPESDDALLLLLKEHKRRGIPAVFKMVGEKSRVLKKRNRLDIIELLSDPLFDIGYHTDLHSVHPTIGEYTERCGWEEGVAEVLVRESNGLKITQELFDKPVLCYGQPGASYTPHVYGAMRIWGVPAYVGGSVYLGLADRPCYIAGRFTVGWLGAAKVSFPARLGEEALKIAKDRISAVLSSPPVGRLISHGGHPNEWSISEWWDMVNFRSGANPPRENWKPAPRYPPERVRRMVKLFGQYLDWLIKQGVELVSLRELFHLYRPGDFTLDPSSACKVAECWAKGEVSFYVDDSRGKSFSAAQLLLGLSILVGEGRKESVVPEIDAPITEAITKPLDTPLSDETIKNGARWLIANALASNSLPPSVELGTSCVALADFASALAACYLRRRSTGQRARFIPADMVRTYGKTVGPWSIHHPSFTGENLRRLTQLLAWSFKPAVLLR
jgi:hypothetical protein